MWYKIEMNCKKILRINPFSFVLYFCIFFLCSQSFVYGELQTIHLPITIDYSILRSSLIQQAFNKPGEKAVPLDFGEGCSGIELWKPEVCPDKDKTMIKLGSNIKVRAGLPIGKTCMPLSEWDGYIEVFQNLFVDQKNMKLGFQTMDFRTLTPDRAQTSINTVLTNIIKNYLNPYLNKIIIDVDAPVKGLQDILPLFFQTKDQNNARSWFSKLRPGQVQIKQSGISLDLLMDIEKDRLSKEKTDVADNEKERDEIVKSWENLDAFSVYQVHTLIGHPVTEEEKYNILEMILDTRHDFIQNLEEGKLPRDLVSKQFCDIWQGFGPLMRKYLTKQQAVSSNFVLFSAVSDVLSSLRNIGPSIGVSFNKDALIKLAKLISVPGLPTDLQYLQVVDRRLLDFFGIGQIVDAVPMPSIYVPEIEIPDLLDSDKLANKIYKYFGFHPFQTFLNLSSSLVFADGPMIDPEKIRPWVFKKNDFSPYVERIGKKLEQVYVDIQKKKRLDSKYHIFFKNLLFATAWQETCWRQFVENKGKVRPLESYNQSSVGFMQINVRVWRGIYQPEALRWDIDYNMRTGCEILDLYLQRYALRRAETRTLDLDTLAMTVYAMYNAGPAQYKKFLLRRKNYKYSKVDQLFWQKYLWVKDGQYNKLSVCLIGK